MQDFLLQFHIVVASAWLGLIGAETVIELTARDRATKSFVADAHRRIDLYFEGPLMALTLGTGSMLLWRIWPAVSALLAVKILAALVAIIANVFCMQWVLARAAARDDATFLHWAGRISLTAYAIPFGLLALAIGLYGA